MSEPPQPSSQPTRGERYLPLLFLLMAFLAVGPIFRYPTLFSQNYDWRYFMSWLEVGRRSLVWFHQMPLWNPYGCGGEVLLANPQSMEASPLAIFTLLFGTALGIKLALVAYYFCAFDGMYRLGRSYRLELPGALLASILFGTGGWLALHISSGHANFASAALFPYLVVFYRSTTYDNKIWAIPLGGVAAWIVCDGGTSTPAMALVLLATLATTDAVKLRSGRPYLTLLMGGACAAALSAFRLLPALEFAVDHPRHQWETDSTMIWQMLRDGYWWRGVQPVPGKRYWFHEYGWRLSYLTPPLILWSLTVKKTRAWWIVTAVGAGIVAGSAIPYGPWWLLKHLPIFRDLRVPSRYAVLFALSFPLLCGAALDDLRARVTVKSGRSPTPRWLQGVTVALLVIACADGMAFDWYCYEDSFKMQMTVADRGTPFYQVVGDWRSMMNHVMAGHGAIGCDEEAPLQRALQLDEGPGPQVKLADSTTAGSVRGLSWTPNRVEVEVNLPQPATVLFNQNWNEHWKTTRGELVKWGQKWPRDLDGGRLAVAAPAGSYSFAVYYRPRSFVAGALLSYVAMPLLLFLFLTHRRRNKAASATSDGRVGPPPP
jgi:hypothetical protein